MAALLLAFFIMTSAQINGADKTPRTFGPLLGSIGSALLGGLTPEHEFESLAQYYGPSYGLFPLVHRPSYGQIYSYGLNGYGHPVFGYPLFRNKRLK
jgi:hypothetical protein